jgi:hypothetical protein
LHSKSIGKQLPGPSPTTGASPADPALPDDPPRPLDPPRPADASDVPAEPPEAPVLPAEPAVAPLVPPEPVPLLPAVVPPFEPPSSSPQDAAIVPHRSAAHATMSRRAFLGPEFAAEKSRCTVIARIGDTGESLLSGDKAQHFCERRGVAYNVTLTFSLG